MDKLEEVVKTYKKVVEKRRRKLNRKALPATPLSRSGGM
jgi:hypothetical protein